LPVTWEHYENGGWNIFAAAASLWLSSAVSDGSADVAASNGADKKPSNMRRIRRVREGDDRPRPNDTDEDQQRWVARLTFYLVKANKLKQLKEM